MYWGIIHNKSFTSNSLATTVCRELPALSASGTPPRAIPVATGNPHCHGFPDGSFGLMASCHGRRGRPPRMAPPGMPVPPVVYPSEARAKVPARRLRGVPRFAGDGPRLAPRRTVRAQSLELETERRARCLDPHLAGDTRSRRQPVARGGSSDWPRRTARRDACPTPRPPASRDVSGCSRDRSRNTTA